MTIRSPSASISTRAPSHRPARIAMSLGMRSPKLLPHRETCTCIGILASVSDIHGISRSDVQVGCRPARSGVEIQRVDLARLADAAQRVMAERLEAWAVAQRGGEFGRNEHLAAQRLAQGLDARDLVDRRTDYGEVEAGDGADISVPHLAQMKGEIDRRGRLAGLGPRGVEPVEPRHCLGRGVERPATNLLRLGRFLQWQGRGDAVAEEFQYLAAA